jgi:UDP-glucose 4-epimerase
VIAPIEQAHWTAMTILVTGGAGFIANTLVDSLLSRGDSVICLDNLCRGTVSNVARFAQKNNFRFSAVDLSDLDAFQSCLDSHVDLGQISEVWHLAANSDIPAGIADPSVDLRDTFMTTFNVLRIMEERNIGELLFASSSAIYGDLGDQELTESAGPLFPISNYGAMKLASEAMITAAAEKFLGRALLFRFPNVVGLPATHGVILDFIRRLRSDPDHLDVLGDGSQRKSYLHVTELVEAMLFIQGHVAGKVDVFNIGPADAGIFVRDIAHETVAAVAPGAQLKFGTENKGWVGDVPVFAYSIAKLSALGWTPKLSSLEAVRRAIGEINGQENPP